MHLIWTGAVVIVFSLAYIFVLGPKENKITDFFSKLLILLGLPAGVILIIAGGMKLLFKNLFWG